MSGTDVQFHEWRLALTHLFYGTLPRQVFLVARHVFDHHNLTPAEAHYVFGKWVNAGGKARLVKTKAEGLARDQYSMVPDPDPFTESAIAEARAATDSKMAPDASPVVVDSDFVEYLRQSLQDIVDAAQKALDRTK